MKFFFTVIVFIFSPSLYAATSTNSTHSSLREMIFTTTTRKSSRKLTDILPQSANRTRIGRFFVINTSNKDKLIVELSFKIPFLTLEKGDLFGLGIKKRTHNEDVPQASTGLKNLNNKFGSILSASALGLAALYVVPKISGMLPGISKFASYARYEDADNFKELFARINQVIRAYGGGTSDCILKAVCSYVKVADNKDTAPSTTKIVSALNYVTRNYLPQYLPQWAIIKGAVTTGQGRRSCASFYRRCPLSADIMSYAAKIMLLK